MYMLYLGIMKFICISFSFLSLKMGEIILYSFTYTLDPILILFVQLPFLSYIINHLVPIPFRAHKTHLH